MVPKGKRPTAREYITKILERPMGYEDLEMIEYFEELERKERVITNFLFYLEKNAKELKPGEARLTYFTMLKDLKRFLS